MSSLAERAETALEPYVGRSVAGTCLGATAISLGKTRDQLDQSDLPAIQENIRKLLAPIAPTAAIDAVLDEIAEETSR